MSNFLTVSDIDRTAQALRARIKSTPRIGIILGSGLGPLAEAVQDPTVIELWRIALMAGLHRTGARGASDYW